MPENDFLQLSWAVILLHSWLQLVLEGEAIILYVMLVCSNVFYFIFNQPIIENVAFREHLITFKRIKFGSRSIHMEYNYCSFNFVLLVLLSMLSNCVVFYWTKNADPFFLRTWNIISIYYYYPNSNIFSLSHRPRMIRSVGAGDQLQKKRDVKTTMKRYCTQCTSNEKL